MVKRRPQELAAEAGRRNREQAARLGADVRAARLRRRLTQARLGERTGIARSTIGAIERGRGAGHTLETWQRLGVALDRPLVILLSRDLLIEPADAGHLRIQELVLRLGRVAGYRGTFELATRPSDPARSADVGLRDDAHQRLVLVECWNTIGDFGAAVRSTVRKLAEARDLASGIGDERPYRVSGCWVVRATARNRQLVARYPEVLASRHPVSSERWVRAITERAEPPHDPGLLWCDVGATRLFPWRRRA